MQYQITSWNDLSWNQLLHTLDYTVRTRAACPVQCSADQCSLSTFSTNLQMGFPAHAHNQKRRLKSYAGSRGGRDNQSEIIASHQGDSGLVGQTGSALGLFTVSEVTPWHPGLAGWPAPARVHRSRPLDFKSANKWPAIISLWFPTPSEAFVAYQKSPLYFLWLCCSPNWFAKRFFSVYVYFEVQCSGGNLYPCCPLHTKLCPG
jgi:hypothetical protein